MPTATTPQPAAPRRASAAKPAPDAAPKSPQPARIKKLPAAAVEATAEAFMAGFKALPGAVQARIVELIDGYEDELDVQELNAAEAANPADFDPKNAVPWEQVKAELAARDASQTAAAHKQAA